jgi:hypothetical protein
MPTGRVKLAFTLGVLVLAGLPLAGRAQELPARVELRSIAHGTSAPLRSYVGATQARPSIPPREIPLRQPNKPGPGGGGGRGGGTPWTDSDLQTTYGPSQLILGPVFQGIGFTGYLPPDQNISVGINSANAQKQIVQIVNTSYAVYDSSGNTLASGDIAAALFAALGNSLCATTDGGDPIVLYDKLDQRWLISQLAYNSSFTDNHFCLAISTSSDATGSYAVYDIPFGTNLPDYPKLAVWQDGIYFSANIFHTGSTFTGAQACSFPRSAVTSLPSTLTFTCNPGGNRSVYNILPADLEGTTLPPTSGPDYYLQFVDNLSSTSGNVLTLYQLSAGSLTTVANLTVNTFHEACGGGSCIPQSGTSQLLDSLGDRLMYRLSYRSYGTSSQAMVASHAVRVSSSSSQTGIRWYRICQSGSSFSICQESTFSPDNSQYRWMGSIAQDKCGDLGLGYSTSSVSTFPSVAVTGKLASESGMELEQQMYPGQSYQAGYSRWGDYTSISLDPSDDSTFWYTNEYVTPPVLGFAFLWQTVIGSSKFVGACP